MNASAAKITIRTYCFIDSQNLHLGIKDQGWTLDYKKLFIYLKEKYKINKAMYYVGYLEENKKLYLYLENCGFNLIFKKTKRASRLSKQIKGNVDVELAVDAIRKQQDYGKAIFISADGDFIPLYDYLFEELNKELLIIIPNQNKYSSFLLKYRSKLRFLNDLNKKLGK